MTNLPRTATRTEERGAAEKPPFSFVRWRNDRLSNTIIIHKYTFCTARLGTHSDVSNLDLLLTSS